MLRSVAIALSVAGSFFASGVFAEGAPEGVTVDDPWARASLAPGRPTAAYMIIRNTSDTDVTLTGVQTDAAMMSEIHITETDANGVAGMRPVGPVVLEPGAVATLEPGGMHAMLMKLKAPLAEGESLELVLQFEGDGELVVAVPVLAATATEAAK